MPFASTTKLKSLTRVLRQALLAVCLLGLGHAPRAEVDMLDYVLRDLGSTGEIDLAQYRGAVTLLMFFEPECPYCFRQARTLNELQAECALLQPVAIGVNGTRQALQREMRRMRAEFPVAQVSERLQQDIGEVVGTPLMLISDHYGMLVTWLQGLQSEQTLRELLLAIDPKACGTLDAAPSAE